MARLQCSWSIDRQVQLEKLLHLRSKAQRSRTIAPSENHQGLGSRREGLPERVFLSTRDEAKRAAVLERLRAQKPWHAVVMLRPHLREHCVVLWCAKDVLWERLARREGKRRVKRCVESRMCCYTSQGEQKRTTRKNAKNDIACCLGPQQQAQPPDTSPQERRAQELTYFPHIAGVIGVKCREGNRSPIARCGPVSENMDCRERMSATVSGGLIVAEVQSIRDEGVHTEVFESDTNEKVISGKWVLTHCAKHDTC